MNFNQTANAFLQQYYQQFDLPYLRAGLKSYYDIADSTFSLNGEVIYGSNPIFEKFNYFPKINNRTILTIDNQPRIDGGTISDIHGRFQYDNGTVIWYSETISMGVKGTTYYVQNQILRLSSANLMQGPSPGSNSFVFARIGGNPTNPPSFGAPPPGAPAGPQFGPPPGAPAGPQFGAPTAAPVGSQFGAPNAPTTPSVGLKFAG